VNKPLTTSQATDPVCPVAKSALPSETDRGNPPPSMSLDSRTLFQTGSVVHIHHEGEIYRLQLTRMGKLILTK
jgi:hemin uptake protein HemP